MSLRHLRRAFSEGEGDIRRFAWRNRDRFAPDYGIRENGPLHPQLRHDVVERALAHHPPSFVPGHDLVVSGGNLSELKVAILIGDRIVGMFRHDHFGIPPDIYVAAHAYSAL